MAEIRPQADNQDMGQDRYHHQAAASPRLLPEIPSFTRNQINTIGPSSKARSSSA